MTSPNRISISEIALQIQGLLKYRTDVFVVEVNFNNRFI